MKLDQAIIKLAELDLRGVQVMTRAEFAELFTHATSTQVDRLLRSLVQAGVLRRVARGVCVNITARSRKGYLIEEIACALRRGHFNYVSLESILSEFGVISQIMISRITVMTTGASGTFKTPYGTIEFTHTKRKPAELRARTMHLAGRPLLLATKLAGIADLKRVGRNIGMIDLDELDEDVT